MSDPDKTREASRSRQLVIFGAVVPCALFLIATIAWTVINGLPNEGRGLPAAIWLLGGVALIGGGYWLADRYWIRPRR